MNPTGMNPGMGAYGATPQPQNHVQQHGHRPGGDSPCQKQGGCSALNGLGANAPDKPFDPKKIAEELLKMRPKCGGGGGSGAPKCGGGATQCGGGGGGGNGVDEDEEMIKKMIKRQTGREATPDQIKAVKSQLQGGGNGK